MDVQAILNSLYPYLAVFVTVAIIAVSVAVVLLIYIAWSIRRIDLPPDADFMTAMRATPFVVVLAIDLLDIGLNFLSAPVSWVILSRLGLAPLRNIAAFEGLLPMTEGIPTMTIAWVVSRVLR